MSVLVSWTNNSAGPLVRGMFPDGLTHADFDGPIDNEVEPSEYVGRFNGDPGTIASFGMVAYTMPAPSAPVPVTMITGAELMARFDKRNPEIWGDIEEISEINANAKAFVTHVTNRMDSPINLERQSIVDALTAIQNNTVATADDITFVKNGIPI